MISQSLQLLVDAGNTRVKWALIAANLSVPTQLDSWLKHGSVLHKELPSLSSQIADAATRQISSIWISNVAGSEIQTLLIEQFTQIAPNAKIHYFRAQPELAGITNAYAQPTQLGCDRFASAIAARHLFPDQALLVVTCGTATTIDAISADARFTGGMILPGLKLMAQSLARNTAQLPEVPDPAAPQPLFADNTQQAIINGCISAQVGAIERAYHGYHADLGHNLDASLTNQKPTCIISGGAAPYLVPHLSIPIRLEDNLVLRGLAVVATAPANDVTAP